MSREQLARLYGACYTNTDPTDPRRQAFEAIAYWLKNKTLTAATVIGLAQEAHDKRAIIGDYMQAQVYETFVHRLQEIVNDELERSYNVYYGNDSDRA